ncbi:hypothetical protein AKJ45_02025 [candidate division MSBL1 archaeon SCGC-AAA261F19]|uniref:Uncharacterized protein n=2 Tax=candidate division MSBL1 TaxID=215777 RepID=A0A133VA14_9EURY|nr:hypothetical protein AKJ43_01845 [candidate division MSBL1 archaeon SCGC-AAA261D19]KXB03281.1 hypothetical protein AKJ45_02025 [candidate division MSBL1 archaeon SCGC-AAA261F19]
MKRGISSTIDVLFLALVITIAFSLLLQAVLSGGSNERRDYAARFAQSTLLSFQQTPARELGGFSYSLDLPIERPSERSLDWKTVTQLIAEDIQLNPKLLSDEESAWLVTNREFDQKLTDFLHNALDKFVGDRFGYRFIVQMPKIELSKGTWVYFRKTLGNFDEDSKLVCSECITLNLLLPLGRMAELLSSPYTAAELLENNELSSPLPQSIERTVAVTVTLELWSE